MSDTIASYSSPVALSYEYTDKGELHLLVKTPYNPEFIRRFKDLVHWPARQWDPRRRIWVVTEGEHYADDITSLIKAHFPNFDIGDL